MAFNLFCVFAMWPMIENIALVKIWGVPPMHKNWRFYSLTVKAFFQDLPHDVFANTVLTTILVKWGGLRKSSPNHWSYTGLPTAFTGRNAFTSDTLIPWYLRMCGIELIWIILGDMCFYFNHKMQHIS